MKTGIQQSVDIPGFSNFAGMTPYQEKCPPAADLSLVFQQPHDISGVDDYLFFPILL